MSIQTKEYLETQLKNEETRVYIINPKKGEKRLLLLSKIPKKNYKNVLHLGCEDGFITFSLPGNHVTGIDISKTAIAHANAQKETMPDSNRFKFLACSIFDIVKYLGDEKFDLIVIYELLYPENVGKAMSIIHILIDTLLIEKGHLVALHQTDKATWGFPYACIELCMHDFQCSQNKSGHRLEVYRK